VVYAAVCTVVDAFCKGYLKLPQLADMDAYGVQYAHTLGLKGMD
jgi:hypothetical protein